jgi:hypothetical protein
MGALFHTPVVQVDAIADLEAWLQPLRSRIGLRVIGTDSSRALLRLAANPQYPDHGCP